MIRTLILTTLTIGLLGCSNADPYMSICTKFEKKGARATVKHFGGVRSKLDKVRSEAVCQCYQQGFSTSLTSTEYAGMISAMKANRKNPNQARVNYLSKQNKRQLSKTVKKTCSKFENEFTHNYVRNNPPNTPMYRLLHSN